MQTLEFTNIDISGSSNLEFSGLFGEDEDGANEDWEASDFVRIEVQIDGGGYQTIMQFANDGTTFNTVPQLDTDFDGIGDGAALTEDFATLTAAIVGTGTLLDIRITTALDSGDKDIAFDALEITGDAATVEVMALNETFDVATGFTTRTGFFSDGAFDFFGIIDGAGGGDFGGEPAPSGEKVYTGTTGNFLTGMDLDGEGASLPITATWENIYISGLSDLKFPGDFGEFFDSPGDIDGSDFLRVRARIDSGAWFDVIDFRGADFSSGSGEFNGVLRQDTDFEGVGDGTALVNALQNFMIDTRETGALLDLQFETSFKAGDEDFAVDNFKIVGTSRGTAQSAVVANTVDGLSLAEEGTTTDTFELSLATEPASNVTVTVEAPDGQSEVSTGGVNFFASVDVVLSDINPMTVTVHAIDDAVDENSTHPGA